MMRMVCDTTVHVILNNDFVLIVVKAVQAANVLLQGAGFGDRHGEEQCIESSIVKVFSNIADGGE